MTLKYAELHLGRLSRVIALDAPGTDEDMTYVYDTAPGCTHRIGRLCQVVDNDGVTTYTYDPFDNLVQQMKIELGVSYTTPYAYDAGNRIDTITYPDPLSLRSQWQPDSRDHGHQYTDPQLRLVKQYPHRPGRPRTKHQKTRLSHASAFGNRSAPFRLRIYWPVLC